MYSSDKMNLLGSFVLKQIPLMMRNAMSTFLVLFSETQIIGV